MKVEIDTDVADTQAPVRLGPLAFNPGVSLRHVFLIFLIAPLASVAFSAVQFLNPYLLELRLGLDAKSQGSMTGMLTLVQEVVIVFASALAGLFADKFGRRVVLASGAICLAIGFLIMSAATAPFELVIARVFCAIGVATVTTVLMIFNADYPTPAARARWAGAFGLMSGLGVVVAGGIITKLPETLVGITGSPSAAGVATFFLVATLCAFIALLSLAGLRGAGDRKSGKSELRRSLIAELSEGILLARDSRELRLAYAAGFTARGNMVVIGGFLFLWNMRVMVDAGHSVADGYENGRQIFLALQISLILGSPVMGLLLDRIDRILGLTLSFGLAGLGYLLLGSANDPMQIDTVWKAIILGVGEAALLASSISLVSQHAPPRSRGSVVGTFITIGAIGMIPFSISAGYLFDNWWYSAPFLMMGFVDLCIMIFGIFTWTAVRRETVPRPTTA